jgi:hypothetical protein
MPPFTRKPGLFLGDQGLVEVSEAVGFPATLLSNETIVKYIVPACTTVFAEGDIVIRHNNAPPPGLREWFGVDNLREGRFAAGLAELYWSPSTAVHEPLDTLQRALAAGLARGIVLGEGPLPLDGLKASLPPLARVEGEDLVFGGVDGQPIYRERLTGPVKYLLAIEPGIRLMHVIDKQVELLARPAFCFNFMCVFGRPFASQFLAQYLLLRAEQVSGIRGRGAEMVDRGFVIPAEGDIAERLNDFVRRDEEIGETHGRVDLVFQLGSRLPLLTPPEAQEILRKALFLLRPGGALLIGFPATPQPPGHISRAELDRCALEAGFTRSPRLSMGASLSSPGLPVYSFFQKADGRQ